MPQQREKLHKIVLGFLLRARTSYSVPSERKIAIEIALPCEML